MAGDKTAEWCFCNQCLRQTRHQIITSHSVSGGDEDISWSHDYQIISCLGCENITYRTRAWCSEWFNGDGSSGYSDSYYPPPVSRQKPEWFAKIPDEIQSVMSEVYVTLQAGSRYLATVGARTALDLLIIDKIGDVGTFKDKINRLQADRHITTAEAALIEAITDAGNASAHRGYAPDAKNLNHVMDILEAILDKFYAAEGRQRKLAAQAAALRKEIPPRTP